MEFLIWMAIGIALMAVELVVPGGILGLIGYCAFLWGVFVALGEGTVALYAVKMIISILQHRILKAHGRSKGYFVPKEN